MAVTHDLLSGMPLVLLKELIRLWNSILPEPGQPSAQLSKLIRLTTCLAGVTILAMILLCVIIFEGYLLVILVVTIYCNLFPSGHYLIL